MMARSFLPIDDALLERWRRLWPTAAVFLAVFATWSHGLAYTDVSTMTDLGLLSVLPPTFYASILILTVSFSMTVMCDGTNSRLLALHVGLLIVVLYTPPMLLYETLRLPWAWKHIGIAEFILRQGGIDRAIAVMPAYHNWPGFFALIAYLADLAGPEKLLAIATWSPLAGHFMLFGILTLIFRSLIDDRQTVWIAIWLYYLANWIGQDYFSPQAFVFPVYLALLGLTMAFLRASPTPHPKIGQRNFLGNWHLLIERAVNTEPGSRLAKPSRLLTAIILILLVTLTISHQLTPAAVIFSLGALFVFRRLRPFWPLLVAIALFGVWLNWPAGHFMASELTYMQQLAGDVLGNASANFRDLKQLSEGQALIAVISRTLTGIVLFLALLGGVMRLSQGRFDISAALLVIAPFAILLIHSYDGEGLFRTYMFATPFLAFFAACLLGRIANRFGQRWGTVFLSIVLWLLALGWLAAYYGNDNHTRTSPGEALAFEFLAKTAPDNTLLIEGSPDYPSRFLNYERFAYVSIIDEPKDSLDLVLNDPAAELGDWLDDDRYAAAYIILTESQRKSIEALGRLPVGVFDRLETTLRRSDRFDVAFENDTATVFVLSAEGRGR